VFKLLASILGGGAAFGGIGDLISAVLGGLNPLAAATLEASPLAANAVPAQDATTVAVSTAPTQAPAAPILLEDDPAAEEQSEEEEGGSSTREEPSSGPKPAGPSATPRKPGDPVGSVVGGVTNVVGGVTGGVTNTVGGVTGGVTNVVGGVTNTVGGLTGGLTGGLGLGPKDSSTTDSGTSQPAA
jgi:hypothetical protein